MFFASIRTEESQPITFHIAYLDPADPDPNPPRRKVQDRWSCVALGVRVPFTLSAITKLAKASDPRSSSLAVFQDEEGLFIWGLIDQGNSYFDFVNHNVDSGPERPGAFQASIAGVGHLAVYREYELLADYRIEAVRPSAVEVLSEGVIVEALWPGIARHIIKVREQFSEEAYSAREHWDASLVSGWLSALRRILLRMQMYRHGGALLISSEQIDLNIKYSLSYERLRTCLERKAAFQIKRTIATDTIFDDYMEKKAPKIPKRLYLDEWIADRDLEETRDEFDGIVWFVSLLSRVDGLILLSPDLEVSGFGVEILTRDSPEKVARADVASPKPTNLTPLDYQHFGTRHRSMMRYCNAHPGSVGLVVSQDGDVRAMTKLGDTVVVWENIKLRLDDFERPNKRKRKDAPPVT
jgi:hypothetical protein